MSLISCLFFVTIKDKSVPPLKKFELGFCLIIFFNSLTVFGAKYFLFLCLITIFLLLIFFNNLIFFELFIKKYYPDFTAILNRYGSVQIRNVGTIAGNIATASPIGDTLPLLLSLDAKIVLDGIKKTEISLNDFFITFFRLY